LGCSDKSVWIGKPGGKIPTENELGYSLHSSGPWQWRQPGDCHNESSDTRADKRADQCTNDRSNDRSNKRANDRSDKRANRDTNVNSHWIFECCFQ
jgi:hypothetical protein